MNDRTDTEGSSNTVDNLSVDSVSVDSVSVGNVSEDNVSASKIPEDNQTRIDALNPLRSICVTAPAGSGKTELLSQRVLTLLARVSQPEEILAITFTRKAAAEMHFRIMEALRYAQSSPEPNQPHELLRWQLARAALDQDKSCNWQLLSNPNRLKIQTIDSLCSLLTRQMPVLSNFGAQPQISDRAERYYLEAVHNLLASLETDTLFANDLITLLGHVDNDIQKVERLLTGLLKKRDQWLLHIGLGQSDGSARRTLETTLDQLVTETLADLHHQILPVSQDLLPLMDYAGCNLQWEKSTSPIAELAGIIELPKVESASVTLWLAVSELLLTKSGTWRKSINKSSGFPTQTQDGDKKLAKELKSKLLGLLAEYKDNEKLLELLIDLRNLPQHKYSDEQWVLLESLTRLLPVLVAQLRLVFQQHSLVDFIEVSIAAAQALGDHLNPTDIAMKLDYQLKHILIDEFQDTSSTQFKLLHRLIEGWSEHNATNPQNPNTLFIVGDGMQSIYGFREANVGLFMEAKESGINGISLDDLRLTVNFRSDPAIIKWINSTFVKAFPIAENLSRGAVPYEMSAAFNQGDNASQVSVNGFVGEGAKTREAQYIVELVEKTLHESPDASIALLVRSRNSLRDIIPELAKAGIQWGAKDINPLANYAVIADLLILTKAMLNIGDKVSWSALLRTPWLGLGNSDMHILIGGDRQNYTVFSSLQNTTLMRQLSPEGAMQVSRAAKIFLFALHNRQRLNIRSWIEGIWLALGGASTVSSLEEYSFVDDYFDLLESYQQGEFSLSMSEFEQAMLSLYAKPLNENANLQVMTIHKAKGLEFDVVILPGLARQSRSDDKSLLMWREYIPRSSELVGSTGLVISPLASSTGEDPVYKYLQYEQALASKLEDTRLLYVAATRAIKELYCLFTTEIDLKTELPKPPASNSLLARIWSSLEDSTIWDQRFKKEAGQMGLDFANENKNNELKRIDSQWQPPLMKMVNPLQEYYIDNQILNEMSNIPELDVDPLPRYVGLVTHAILERLAKNFDQFEKDSTQSGQFWREMDHAYKTKWLNALLHDQGLNSQRWESAVVQIIQNIENVLEDKKGQWILFGQHQYSYSEMKISSCNDNGINNRIIDRCFIDSNEDCWIVDYKSSRPQLEESQQAFIERESLLYSSQLSGYRRDISEHSRFSQCKNIRTALYFTALPYWLELES